MSHGEITHLDLFSGIGGFALAADRVWSQGGVRHIFCDNEPFAQEVLRKHWPDAPVYGDIRSLTADSYRERHLHGEPQKLPAEGPHQAQREPLSGFESPFILTGGFPCQPFSQAGRRRGEEDDRFLWPEMCRVIGEFKPTWVIAENVRGLLTQGGGVVFERVCADLEALGYEVQPVVIPAVALGAPHRRDRVWFIASRRGTHTDSERVRSSQGKRQAETVRTRSTHAEPRRASSLSPAQDSIGERPRGRRDGDTPRHDGEIQATRPDTARDGWRESWLTVAARLCRVDDGVPRRLDRNPRLKALGNAIVPQVAEEIMRAIRNTYEAGA